jgi:anaerobic selenocysteine-containing dehydrogenase
VAQKKLFPRGVVELGKEDMERLGVRQGWPVKVRSASGEAVAPVALRPGLAPGVVVVPYALRDALAQVMGGRGVASVAVERA